MRSSRRMNREGARSAYMDEFVSGAGFGKNNEVGRFLRTGMDVDAMNRNGYTGLMAAVCQGRLGTVKLLVSNRANVNLATPKSSCDVVWGKTALHLAVLFNEPEICSLLIREGADVNAKNSLRCTPLMIAKRRGHRDIEEMLLRNHADEGTMKRIGSYLKGFASRTRRFLTAEIL